jgi:hypothetical protein
LCHLSVFQVPAFENVSPPKLHLYLSPCQICYKPLNCTIIRIQADLHKSLDSSVCNTLPKFHSSFIPLMSKHFPSLCKSLLKLDLCSTLKLEDSLLWAVGNTYSVVLQLLSIYRACFLHY